MLRLQISVGAVEVLKCKCKANFALSSLERFGIDTSLMQEVKDASGVPTSFVLLSTDTGARTIVSSRCGLKEPWRVIRYVQGTSWNPS